MQPNFWSSERADAIFFPDPVYTFRVQTVRSKLSLSDVQDVQTLQCVVEPPSLGATHMMNHVMGRHLPEEAGTSMDASFPRPTLYKYNPSSFN